MGKGRGRTAPPSAGITSRESSRLPWNPQTILSITVLRASAFCRKDDFQPPALAERMHACNRRYLDFLSAVDDPTPQIKKVHKISRAVKKAGRSYRGFNLLHGDDEAVFRAVARGEAQGFGVRNCTLRVLLGKTSGQVSRILKRLGNHGLIKKVANTYKYYLTSLGREVVATWLKLKELFVIPSLRGTIQTP